MVESSAAGAGDKYRSVAALVQSETRGRDYTVTALARPASTVAIIAPHGGSIERRTSAIARAIADQEHNLYLFEGLDPSGSYETLHITSHRFDEPACLELVARCDTVVAVHGCSGAHEAVMLGGLDEALIAQLANKLRAVGVSVMTDSHAFPGRHRQNICNRGRRGRGVQLELTDGLRGSALEVHVISTVREVLQGLRQSHQVD